MQIMEVKIVHREGAPEWCRKIYKATLINGEETELFEELAEVKINQETLKGLTVAEARHLRTRKVLSYAIG